MKRIMACILLVATLLCFAGSAFADSNSENGVYFSPVLLKVLDHSAKEWMSNETNRAILAACALLDYALQDDVPYDIRNMYFGTVFVGRISFVLVVAYNDGSDQSLIILFDTSDSDTMAYTIASIGKSRLEMTMESLCTEGYYKVDPVDLKEVNDTIAAALSQ